LPVADLQLLTEAARAAGAVARAHFRTDLDITEKPGGAGPVTQADLAVNRLLEERLRDRRPGYGWLSEESAEDGSRARAEHVFIVDPIDGTRSFIEGADTWAHSLAVTRGGLVTAAVVYLPERDLLYAASRGGGATLNGQPIRASGARLLASSNVLTARPNLDPHLWKGGVPDLRRSYRPSLAWRLALVAEGRFDGMFTFRPSWEWDIAAGSLLCEEAGARVSDQRGLALRFNAEHPQTDGVIAAAPDLHGDILNRRA
jgi:myo-inositol-1(or 4)-monophosphatase